MKSIQNTRMESSTLLQNADTKAQGQADHTEQDYFLNMYKNGQIRR